MSGWIGVDLDAMLAYYETWGIGEIGDPVPLMAARVHRWLAEGREVRIFTARVAATEQTNNIPIPDVQTFIEKQRTLIQDWTEKHFGRRLQVTATKDYGMVELWDDRAVQVIPNTGRRADGRE